MEWVAPPDWPQPPSGWSPYPGWEPDPSWGPPPENWQWWQPSDVVRGVRREYSTYRTLYWVALLCFLPIYLIIASLTDVDGAPWALVTFGAGVGWLLFVGWLFRRRGHADVVHGDDEDAYPVLRPHLVSSFPRASAVYDRVVGSGLFALVLGVGSLYAAYWLLTRVPDGSVAGVASLGAECQEPAWRGALYGDPNSSDPSRCRDSATDSALGGGVFLIMGLTGLLMSGDAVSQAVSSRRTK